MAECHPVAFRWVMQAKLKGAKLIHADPRFTRTSAMADLYAPVRAGSDIAFLGGLVRYVLESKRWQEDAFFQDYLRHYTNASTLLGEEFQDTEDLGGVFSGLMDYTGGKPEWPFNGFVGEYEKRSWEYDRGSRTDAKPEPGDTTTAFDALIRGLRKPAAKKDSTLQDQRTVFQVVRRHFSRYTPEMVSSVTGCPVEGFLKVAETVLANSGRDRTTAWAYAVGWTQHTYGPQMIGCAALLQLLLGNIGRPGGGVIALRGHVSIQGSTDIPTLYDNIHGYMPAPSVLRPHSTLRDYLKAEAKATGAWADMPKFLVSYLKSMYGDAATAANDYGYGWHPRIIGDHSHLPMFVAMAEGRVKGMICVGQNPATSVNASLERKGLRKLEWLVVKDNFLTETATHWQRAPEIADGSVATADIATEVFFFPSAQVAETEGSFTNTQRLLQWHYKAAEAPGSCRSDLWFTYQLGLRLKRLYAGSTESRDQGFQNLTWEFAPDDPALRAAGEPDARKLLREINGYHTGEPTHHLSGATELKDDGSTTCASWIYCGVYPAPGRNLAQGRTPDAPGVPGAQLHWGWAWPANRRVLYNRAAADPEGKPWSERKRWIWWDGSQWTGYDTPDFDLGKAPRTPADPSAVGADALSGSDPFILKPDGVGWLYVPEGLLDGPMPTHYEPAESPVRNPLYQQQASPVLKYWKRADNLLAPVGDGRYPHVITTYRLTEHYVGGGMSRWSPWLSALQPELFIEMSPELAGAKGISNTGWVRITTPRGSVRARALVTRRLRPFVIGGKLVHQVGMPWHWGWEGLVTGDAVNGLTALVGDPNISIHEAKAFVCNVEKA